jgi:hypothetical protein
MRLGTYVGGPVGVCLVACAVVLIQGVFLTLVGGFGGLFLGVWRGGLGLEEGDVDWGF